MRLTEKMVEQALGDYTVKAPIIRKLVTELNRFMGIQEELVRIRRQRKTIDQTADREHDELDSLMAIVKQGCPHYATNASGRCLACNASVE